MQKRSTVRNSILYAFFVFSFSYFIYLHFCLFSLIWFIRTTLPSPPPPPFPPSLQSSNKQNVRKQCVTGLCTFSNSCQCQKISKFADDTKITGRVTTTTEKIRIQSMLYSLVSWPEKWQMVSNVEYLEFSPSTKS